jgi:hypothetical protein
LKIRELLWRAELQGTCKVRLPMLLLIGVSLLALLIVFLGFLTSVGEGDL